MIVEAIVGLLVLVVRVLIQALPNDAPPGWLDDASGYLNTIWTAGAGLGAWIPWTVFGVVAASVALCIVIGFGIKLTRIVLSYVTLGGGSAG